MIFGYNEYTDSEYTILLLLPRGLVSTKRSQITGYRTDFNCKKKIEWKYGHRQTENVLISV